MKGRFRRTERESAVVVGGCNQRAAADLDLPLTAVLAPG